MSDHRPLQLQSNGLDRTPNLASHIVLTGQTLTLSIVTEKYTVVSCQLSVTCFHLPYLPLDSFFELLEGVLYGVDKHWVLLAVVKE